MLVTEQATAYFANPAINKSALDAIRLSPLHYQRRIVERTAAIEPTPAMALGTLVHTLVLEPEEVFRRYAMKPALDRRTKAGKEAYAAWEAELNGREALQLEIHDMACSMSAAVLSHPIASELLEGAICERSAYGVDPESGLDVKARIDAIQGTTLVDLKTCRDASSEGFARSVASYRYHVQAAHYMATYQAATGHQVDSFVFVAVESAPPYAVGVYQLDPASLAFAAEQRREDLAALSQFHSAQCPASYNNNQLTTISLPPWVMRSFRPPLQQQQLETY